MCGRQTESQSPCTTIFQMIPNSLTLHTVKNNTGTKQELPLEPCRGETAPQSPCSTATFRDAHCGWSCQSLLLEQSLCLSLEYQ